MKAGNNMTISEIVTRSTNIDQFCEKYTLIYPEMSVFGILLYDETMAVGELLSDVLYITSPDRLPKALPGNGAFNFLLCTENEMDRNAIPDIILRRCNILTTKCSLQDSVRHMEMIIFNERRIESAMRRITEALFASGLHKMIAVGADQLRCPILLANNSGEIMEKNRGNSPEFTGEAFSTFWDQTERADSLLEEADHCSMESEEMHHYLSMPGVKAFHMEEMQVLVIAFPIRVSKIEVGKIFAFTKVKEFPALEAELLYRLSLIVGDELQKHNTFHVERKQRYINFMWMLLEGKYPNLRAIDRAMEELGIVFKGKCCVALIHIINEGEEVIYENDMLNVLSSQINAKLSDTLWVIHNKELVIVFNFDRKEDLSDYEISILQKIADTSSVSVGISHSCQSLVEVGQLYWQASQAAEFGHEYMHSKLTFFKDISQYSMCSLLQKNVDPMIFVEQDLMKLYISEKENHQDYFTTLYYYLKYGGNTGLVAKKTHIHRNTVLYRIDKLQQKMGFDLSSGVSEMKYMISFEILKYLKLFQPED